ncbi:hypothetical protein COLO4_04525 [Corchorus olitorius]|uniref:Uncharacterized protein n=1 Tax=Corchorus olitorius TaxID=93759 RepID=A0A1R3KTP3_9ROSI|nr:hypothetical protein COLO4_04525 [Corchorus olitorius]
MTLKAILEQDFALSRCQAHVSSLLHDLLRWTLKPNWNLSEAANNTGER